MSKLPTIQPTQLVQKGFTLIEAVVSLFLLAIMSVMSYQAVEVVLSANQRSQEDLSGELRLQKTWQVITNDLIHLRARAFSDGYGTTEAAYETGRFGSLVSFSRGQNAIVEANPTGVTRVRYQLNAQQELLRISQPIFLSPRVYESKPQVLLNDVADVSFEQLNRQRFFVEDWPPNNTNSSPLTLPSMIKVSITLVDGSITSKLFPVVANAL